MVNSKVARRYAKSLLLLSNERNKTARVYQEMRDIRDTARESREFDVFLKSPVIKKDKKLSVIDKVFNQGLSPEVSGFIRIITKNNREALLADIAASFVELYLEQTKVQRAEVVTAIPLSEALRVEVRQTLKTLASSDIELTETVSPEIIGGIVLRIGDRQYDASVLKKIKLLKQKFNTREYQVSI
jgi:F-type H+-transporting ATPase subunit delta